MGFPWFSHIFLEQFTPAPILAPWPIWHSFDLAMQPISFMHSSRQSHPGSPGPPLGSARGDVETSKKKGGSSAGKMEISPFHPSEMEISPWKIEISPWEIGIYHEKWRGKDQTYGNSWRSNGLGQRKIAQKGCFYQPNIGGSCRCCLQLSLESKDTLLHVCSVCVGSTLTYM